MGAERQLGSRDHGGNLRGCGSPDHLHYHSEFDKRTHPSVDQYFEMVSQSGLGLATWLNFPDVTTKTLALYGLIRMTGAVLASVIASTLDDARDLFTGLAEEQLLHRIRLEKGRIRRAIPGLFLDLRPEPCSP
ncbi:MAG: hypothetical protein ACNA8S_09960 [Deferrisomatales bacterium]